MRIQCPECEAALSLGQPKPGTYKPKCKYCHRPFRLKVSDDDPPKIVAVKIKPRSAKQSSSRSENRSASATKANSPEMTVDRTLDQPQPSSPQSSSPQSSSPEEEAKAARSLASDAHRNGAEEVDQDLRHTIDAVVDEPVDGRDQSLSVASPSQHREPSPAARGEEGEEIPERLGGYRILKLLGRGAMGSVYEAKQVSLDRQVALKTIRGRMADNPASLARFAREAYAAAQLTHHNVVQIYDFGEDAGRHFFSMEWVRGGPLDALIREKGPLEARVAASYALQAARGLQFAHRNGMVHRDVKPANLLLSDEGVIKVADLGLVKIPDQGELAADDLTMSGLVSGTQVTMQGTAVGTPAYMAPEQSVDAAAVDHRADIYSLGCTLFYMLTGRPPFDGTVVSEVMEQHASQALPDLSQINGRVPEAVQHIVTRAMAKRPQDRYESLAEMVTDLESYLGVSPDGRFTPTSEQADQWEAIATQYRAAAPLARWNSVFVIVFLAVSGLLTVVLPFAGLSWMLVGPTLFASALMVSVGLGERLGGSAVMSRFRKWVGSLSWWDIALACLGAVALLFVVLVAGMTPGLVVGMFLGIAVGACYHFAVAVPSKRSLKTPLAEAERFIRDLRIEGADENGVRSFAARYAGADWQRLYEELFGYDALCTMRASLQGDPSFTASTKSDSWRDRICARLHDRAEANREASDRRRLAKLEERGLQSEGLTANEAKERAWQMAAAVMDNAKLPTPMQDLDAENAAQLKRERMKAMLADARSGEYRIQRDRYEFARFALGGHTRLLAGCLLLVLFVLWGNHHGVFDSFKTLDTIEDFNAGQVDLDEVGNAFRGAAATGNEVESESMSGGRINGWSLGVAGLLLLMSAFVSGWRMTPFAVVATLVILFGPSLGMPGVGERLQPWMVAACVGIAIYLPGIVFGESRDDAN
ncbi:MAG: bifunctional serine/threonine protein kinase/MFS transporter [Rubripirellula sp.]